MKNYLTIDKWKIIEESFDPTLNRISESIFSIANGHIGLRGNFEETYSGDSLKGSYIGGIYYPDKTKVGWWKNGYPEYFAKVLNSVNWIGIDVYIQDQKLDISKVKFSYFRRELNMKTGFFKKHIKFKTDSGSRFEIVSERFCSMERKELGVISYTLKSINYNGPIRLEPFLDFNVCNEDSNYDEQFWNQKGRGHNDGYVYVEASTKKTNFTVHAGMQTQIKNGNAISQRITKKEGSICHAYNFDLISHDEIRLIKYCTLTTTLDHTVDKLKTKSQELNHQATFAGYEKLKEEQVLYWQSKWAQCDIKIVGDDEAQQGIRFSIFQLLQTYTGHDARLNIGPKGFTGEKYGGSTYWDTEAYCIPFYLGTSDQEVSKNLLIYRFNQLPKAIENAAKLGFNSGAALFPMVTMNGEECHNEWEITFEEIHRNGAIVYAIYDYIKYTGDHDYMANFGIDVVVSVARFWAQRVNWSSDKDKYVMLGVTGPNEYENNVNNNWYTNYIASWCLQYAINSLNELKLDMLDKYLVKMQNLSFKYEDEVEKWIHIIDHMYLPKDEKNGIYLQQDGFLDKELKPAESIPSDQNPICQNWSWDRILRSCFIKQADVLQGLYFFETDFSLTEITKNFEFYEPMTVHESSLSPCVHSILASKIGRHDKAYELYLRAARLDLDDYNNDTADGLHITSMAGSWMSVIKGFAGFRVEDNMICLRPYIPKSWNSYSFKLNFRSHILEISVSKDGIQVANEVPESISINLFNNNISIKGNSTYSSTSEFISNV